MQYYLRSDRDYRYGNLRIQVKKGVFHPGLFYSTKLLLAELKKENLQRKTLLELGAGSGLISVFAAQQGAKVTATDINPQAVENVRLNFTSITPAFQPAILQSDLFEQLPQQKFDYIIINPPYYAKDPQNEAEKAWYCGKDFRYFEKLFACIGAYVQPDTRVWLSMSDDCDLQTIRSIANRHHRELKVKTSRKTMGETTYIYTLEYTEN